MIKVQNEVKVLERRIKRLIDERNDLVRSDSIEFYEHWTILRGTSRKLTKEEVDAYHKGKEHGN